MNRHALICSTAAVLGAAALPRAARATETDVSLQTASGTLFGTLRVPQGQAPFPLVVLHAGSGPTDRNGGSPLLPGLDTLAALARALDGEGVATLRYDKRGIAASAAAMLSETKLRFDVYVDDLQAWVAELRGDRRFSRCTLAGHSEGALIATLAARRGAGDALVTLEGAGRPLAVVLREQFARVFSSPQREEALHVLDELVAGRTVDPVPQSLQAVFRPSVQPYLISELAYDPAKELAAVRVPVTIVQGTADVQTGVADGAALHAAKPDAAYVVVDGMNHVLKHAPDTSTNAAVIAGYTDPTVPIEPAVVAALALRAKR